MEWMNTFISNYGMEIIGAIVAAIAAWLGTTIKNIYNKFINDKTKEAVVKIAVKGVEQIYRELHGEDKLNKAIEAASEMLAEKGITISEFELRMLIESTVAEFNDAFNKTSTDTVNEDTVVETK